MNPSRCVLPFVVGTLLAPAAARAQCALSAMPGDPLRQMQGDVDALATWDPDGAGSLPLHLVAGGTFDVGTAANEHVVLWDGANWTPTHANFGHVSHLIVWNGLLVAAAGELLWTYDGAAWTLLAGVEEGSPTASLPGVVNALTLWNGDLVVGGRFTRLVAPFVSVAANLVAKLNATTGWSALGTGPVTTGMAGPHVQALTVFNNTVWAGLGFTTNFGGGPSLQFLNGSSWIGQGTGVDPIDALATRIGTTITNSWLFVASHSLFGSAVSLSGFNPVLGTTTTITAPPVATATSIDRIFVRGTGLTSYEVACTVTSTGTNWARAWRWTAAGGWVALPILYQLGVVHVNFFGGRYVAGVHGWTFTEGSLRSHDSAAGTWVTLLGPGFDDHVRCVCHDGQSLVVGGAFTTASGIAANRIARGNANAWTPLGPGFGPGVVHAVARMPNGDLVAGGSFLTLGDGTPMSRIARWNGSAWSPLGSGVNGDVHALLPLPNGDLVVGGKFLVAGGQTVNHVARWNGSAWSSLGAGCNAWVYCLLRLDNGDLVAGGAFSSVNGQPASRIARWNGSAWSSFGAGLSNVVWALAQTSDGIVAGGEFLNSGGTAMPHVAQWNGSTWAPLDATSSPSQPIVALAALPGGGVAVGGAEFSVSVAGTPVSTCVALWRGAWQSLDVRGLGANALAFGSGATLAVGGYFTRAGQWLSVNVARVASSCPATAATFATGCPSSGGANTLAAVTLPWANGVFRTQATGLPANALVLTLTSVTPVVPGVPLSLLLAEGVPGCDLRVAPDILGLTVAAGGSAQSEFLLPNTPPIVGVSFYQQMVPIEFDPGTGAWLAITATNALQLVGGFF